MGWVGAEHRASHSRPAACRGALESRGSRVGKKTVLRVHVKKWSGGVGAVQSIRTSARKTVRSGLLAG